MCVYVCVRERERERERESDIVNLVKIIQYRVVGETLTGVSIDQVSAVPILAGIGCTFINFKVAVFTIEARSTSTLIVIKSILNDECTRSEIFEF